MSKRVAILVELLEIIPLDGVPHERPQVTDKIIDELGLLVSCGSPRKAHEVVNAAYRSFAREGWLRRIEGTLKITSRADGEESLRRRRKKVLEQMLEWTEDDDE